MTSSIEVLNPWRLKKHNVDLSMNLIHDAFQYVCDKYQMNPHVTIDLRDCDREFGIYGAVNCEDHQNQHFYMMLDYKVNWAQFMLTFMHEMIHVWQTCRGDSVQLEDDVTIWKKMIFHFSTTDYENRPWEQEAHALEQDLLEEWIQNSQYNPWPNSLQKISQ